MVKGINSLPSNATFGNGRIYFDQPSGKFKVSENGGAYVNLVGGAGPSPWIQGTGFVTQGIINDKVGIGTNTPSSLLHIVNSVPSPSQLILGNINQPNVEWEWRVDAVSNLSLINEGNGSPFTSFFAENTGKIGIGTNTPGASLDVVSLSNSAAVNASTSGSASAGIFSISNAANTSNALQANTNGSGSAISGSNSGSGNAGYFNISNAGSSGTGIQVTTAGTGNALNANANSGTAINAVSTGAVATELIFNNGSGDGLQIFSTTGRGINATNTSNIVSAAQFYNDGTSNSLFATKNSTTTAGNVARFENNSTLNTADAMYVKNLGTGAAIHAISGPTVEGSSNAALWLESGHIKSTQLTAPTTGSVSVSGGGLTAAAPSLSNATDVKGKLTAVITTTTLINSGNNTTIRVTFNKAYSIIPSVVVTPLTDLLGMSYFVTNVTTTTFDLTIKNSTAASISTPVTWTVNFNYMVIE